MITAKIIADSVAESGIRVTTFQLKFNRFILPEFNTHRMFSRNASSSRAIPVKKLLQNILNDIAYPIHWGANQSGMQAKTELVGWKKISAKVLWKSAAYIACGLAWGLDKLGAHKQIVNRITEPFAHIDVIVTATNYSNFFALRYHPDAQPEIAELAKQMYEQYIASEPKFLLAGVWHLPYITNEEKYSLQYTQNDLIKISVARCARVSYLNHDQSAPDMAKDIKLYERLLGGVPLHASPSEHQCTPDVQEKIVNFHGDLPETKWKHPELHGNLTGWIQYRKTLPNECIKEFNL